MGEKSEGAFSRSATRVGCKTRVLLDSLNAVDTVSTNKAMLFWEVGSGRSLTRSLIFESISVVIFGVEDDLSDILTTREMVRDCTNLNSNFVFDFSGLILFYLIHFYLYRSLQFICRVISFRQFETLIFMSHLKIKQHFDTLFLDMYSAIQLNQV